MTADEIELGVAEGSSSRRPLAKRAFSGAAARAASRILRTRVDADDLRDVRSEARTPRSRCRSQRRGRASFPVNGPRSRRSAARDQQLRCSCSASLQLDAHVAASALASDARELERFLARRDRPGCPFLVDDVEDTSDRGAGIETELVAADERRRRIGEPRRLDHADELRRADEARAHRAPTARCSRRKRWIARGDGSSGRRARRSAAA